jgi:hypothetical protein
MSNIREAREALVRRILDGAGTASRAVRRAAFENSGLAGSAYVLADKTARVAHRITDEDIAAVKASGLSEDQVFEVVVCAAVGQAVRQHDAALAALDAATGRRNATANPR